VKLNRISALETTDVGLAYLRHSTHCNVGNRTTDLPQPKDNDLHIEVQPHFMPGLFTFETLSA
jgi:hypothetical protein